MVSGSTFSVPVIPKSSLNETIEGHGMRLDGRHYEEFRSVCESSLAFHFHFHLRRIDYWRSFREFD